jgi:hypothetical protein
LNTTDEDPENNISDKEGDKVPEVMVDDSGHPILSTCDLANLKMQQDVVREIFTKAYSAFICFVSYNMLIIIRESCPGQKGPCPLAGAGQARGAVRVSGS